MNKARHKPEEIKRYTDAIRKFRMPPLPLLTLDGIKEKTTDNELETSPTGDKPQE